MAGGHDTKRVFVRDTWMRKSGRATQSTHVLYPALFAVLVAVGGILTVMSVRGHIIESLRDELLAIQGSQEAAIRLWLQAERADVTGWAFDPEIRAAVVELTDSDGSTTAADTGARGKITEQLAGLLRYQDVDHYAVLDRAGEVVASSEARFIGDRLTASGRELVQSVLRGESRVTLPSIIGNLFQSAGERRPPTVTVKAAPVRNFMDEIVAVLLVAVRPEEFAGILGLGRFGQTGVTYLVTRDGWMLFESRVRDQLEAVGFTVAGREERVQYSVRAGDPGGDLARGYVPPLPANRWPLTYAAAAIAAGGSGYELEGYRNYGGVRVMGTWRWLDDLELGLVTEVRYSEALRPLRPLIIAVASLFFMLVVAVAALLLYARIVRRLSQNIESIRKLGQYTLLEKIGEGAMGRVYRARHSLLARDTAVKMLKPDVVSEEAIARFEQEVQKTSQLTHPNTVEIYDFGRTDQGIFFYAMEYLDGHDLGTLLDMSGPLPPARAVHVLRQVCLSLREAHEAGLIHRDIKPKNIILCARGGEYDVVKVVDFGLVKEVGVQDRGVTQMNIIPGTPPYIAPECMRDGVHIDARVDIYALGAVGFSLLTGEPVFDGDTSVEIAYKAMHEDPARPSERASAAIPESLDRLIHSMLATDREERPGNVDEVLARLDDTAAVIEWNQEQAESWWQNPPAVEH